MTTSDTTNDAATAVRTTDGLVRGIRSDGLLAFRGIPYAAPPVGPLRLRAPQPVAPWEGELDASTYGDAAVQPRAYTRTGLRTFHPSSENALTLNVLAKPGSASAKRPVMVFVHGGAYSIGTSATPIYGGESLVRRGDVVYVSINYRLGALGYLDFTRFATPERPFDSNLGLRDQVAALEWVQRNIAAFGGDPDNVTVFGESAGGDAVTTLMATPAAKGLFARAIAESPAPGLVNPAGRAQRWAADVVAALGADPGDAADVLSTCAPSDLGRAANTVSASVVRESPGLSLYGPTVDGDFLPRPPIEAFRDGTAHRVPLVIGTNAREGTLFPRFLDALPTNPDRIETMFARTDPDARDRVVAAYPGYPEDADASVNLGGDITFWWPSIEIAQEHSEYAPTYMYRFDYAPRLLRTLGFDATHGLELFAVFGLAKSPVGTLFSMLGGRRGFTAVSDAVQRQWIQFAHDGTTTASWPRYDTARRATLVFDEVTQVVDDPRRERRVAWEGYSGYRGQGM